MLDEAAVFLRNAWKKSRHIDKSHDWNIEAVAEAHEAGGLARGVGVERAGEDHGLIGDKANCAPFDAAKACHDIARISFLDLEEIALVHGLGDEFLDVVGLCRIVRRQGVERGLASLGVIEARPLRNIDVVFSAPAATPSICSHEPRPPPPPAPAPSFFFPPPPPPRGARSRT